MSEKRTPAFYVVKRKGKYLHHAAEVASELWGPRSGCTTWASHERGDDSGTFATGWAKQEGGRVVPVFVTTRTVKRGHSWAWACRRMLEGKRVRRAAWATFVEDDDYRYIWLDDSEDVGKLGDAMLTGWRIDGGVHQPAYVAGVDMRATDWELRE